jgi:hypothetical protein
LILQRFNPKSLLIKPYHATNLSPYVQLENEHVCRLTFANLHITNRYSKY